MADLLTGADAVVDEVFSYQKANKFKNHYRGATAPADIQPGMLFSDSDDDRLYHRKAAANNEVLQIAAAPAIGDIVLANAASGIVTGLPDVALGRPIVSGGVGAAPKYLAAGLDGQVFVSNGAADPGWEYQPKENLLDNSGFGVWSNSDTNKGLGTMPYDAGDSSGHTAPVVGETMTGGTSGAVGKIISYTVTGGSWAGGNAAGVITLGACAGRFNDNEVVTGGTGAAHCVVNTPPAGAGVDLVQNGEFETATTGWTAADCTLASVAGGQVGNCLEITRTGGGAQQAYQTILTLTVGKLYRVSVYVKSGTSGNEVFSFLDGYSGAQFSVNGTSSGAWVKYTADFECKNARVDVGLWKNTATAGTMLFDEISLYEITPCCTAADYLAMDGWLKSTSVDLYRQHYDSTYTKDGAYYSLKVVPANAGTEIDVEERYNKEEFYQQYTGRTLTKGAFVYAATASHARLFIRDSTGSSYSSYHSGTPGWEWLEVSKTISASATSVLWGIQNTEAGNVNGSTIIYISQPMLVFGPSIGQGNYAPKPNEMILTEKVIPLTNYTATTSAVDATINLEAESAGMIPKGAKAVLVKAYAKDSAAGDGVGFDLQSSSGVEDGISVDTQVNNIRVQQQGIVKCDSNGDCYYDHRGSGAAALTTDIKVIGVLLR